jgi:hypothetical protein
VIDYLRDELSHLKKFQRLIFRPHPWFQNDIKKQELGVIFGPGVQIEFWDDLFNPYPDFPELTEPEAILWNVQGSPKYFFGFRIWYSIFLFRFAYHLHSHGTYANSPSPDRRSGFIT